MVVAVHCDGVNGKDGLVESDVSDSGVEGIGVDEDVAM